MTVTNEQREAVIALARKAAGEPIPVAANVEAAMAATGFLA